MDVFDLMATLRLDASGYENGLESARRASELFAGQVGTVLGGLGGSAVRWGQDMTEGFIDGMNARAGALREAVSGLAGLVRSYLHFSEPDVGPLADFSAYAPDMMATFAEGIRAGGGLVSDALDAALRPARELLAPAGPGAWNPGGTTLSGPRPAASPPEPALAEIAASAPRSASFARDTEARPAARPHPVHETPMEPFPAPMPLSPPRAEEALFRDGPAAPPRAAPQESAPARDIHIILELDGQAFGRAVYRANNDETQRVGLSLTGVTL